MSAQPESFRVLSAVLDAIRHATEYPDVLVRICEAVTKSVPCDSAIIYVWSRRRRAFLPIADHGTPEVVRRRFVERGFRPRTFPGDADLRAGRTVIAVRGATSPELEEVLRLAEFHSLVVMPLAFQKGPEGSLAIGLHTDAFWPEQIAAIEQVAPQIAVLIQNAHLEALGARVAERRTRLAAWAAEVLGANDLDAMASSVCEASRVLFSATRSVLLLARGDELIDRHVAGLPLSGPLSIPLSSFSAHAEALRSGRVLVVNDFAHSPYATGAGTEIAKPAAFLAVPLIDTAGPLGLLTVSDLTNSYRFGATDEEDARLLAAVATVSLRKHLLVDALKRASDAKSEFLASVSHDLRTPLNVIMGYMQLMAEGTFGPVTEEQSDALSRALRTAQGQLGLINDLLDLARIEQGKFECHFRAVPVAELVPSLREMMEPVLMGRPVRFEVDVADNAVAHTDPERLRQVLVNLLVNASKFTQAGCIRLLAKAENAAVRVAVSDTGRGMDASLVAHAHEPFVRGDGTGSGSGLGLAIVARLTALLGGQFTIQSTPGGGTTVRLQLPAA